MTQTTAGSRGGSAASGRLGRAPGIAIGTSGWSYASWRGPFYPPDLAQPAWLPWYASQFATAEINGSFYRTPTEAAVKAWRAATPPDFVLAWKASKFITHWKRLKDSCDTSLALMEQRARLLGPKLGPILFQLPANFRADRERLAQFIRMLPRRRRFAFEFRHPSWFVPEVFELLADNDLALCIGDHHSAASPWVRTAHWVYVRGHGPTGRYRDTYPEARLRAWARQIGRWRREGRDVFVYFDNDQKSAAPADARRLRDLIGKPVGARKPTPVARRKEAFAARN